MWTDDETPPPKQGDSLVQYIFAPGTDPLVVAAAKKARNNLNEVILREFPDGGGVLFCERPPDTVQTYDPNYCPPDGFMHDDYTVEIHSTTYDGACNEGFACVKGEHTEAIQKDRSTGHLLNMRMFIELEPKVAFERTTTDIVWTDDQEVHGTPVTIPTDYGEEIEAPQVDLVSVMMHELLHAAGLMHSHGGLMGWSAEDFETLTGTIPSVLSNVPDIRERYKD